MATDGDNTVGGHAGTIQQISVRATPPAPSKFWRVLHQVCEERSWMHTQYASRRLPESPSSRPSTARVQAPPDLGLSFGGAWPSAILVQTDLACVRVTHVKGLGRAAPASTSQATHPEMRSCFCGRRPPRGCSIRKSQMNTRGCSLSWSATTGGTRSTSLVCGEMWLDEMDDSG
jgi:hypothetical protein